MPSKRTIFSLLKSAIFVPGPRWAAGQGFNAEVGIKSRSLNFDYAIVAYGDIRDSHQLTLVGGCVAIKLLDRFYILLRQIILKSSFNKVTFIKTELRKLSPILKKPILYTP